ncbi:RNA polymerase II degradation factor isoform X2 [Wolffia australiana]
MEIAASRGGSPAVPSPSRRKDRRTVPDLGLRNNGPGVSEHGKLGQSDERTIYEVQEEGGQLEMSFSSVAIDDAGAGEDLMQRRLHSVSRKREELEQMEVELKAQIFARSEIMEVQRKYETQIKEHINAIAKLKEQLHEREQCICTLEMKVEDKDRELRAAKIDNEAVWAKEDLLREQNKELANMRRECEGLEAERAQHIKQIHDLQECIQGKEHRYLELEEQHRVAQETILFKDEQLREAQAWMVRAQEVDAFHLTTNQTLQAEIRERTEQFNQYFLGLHKQFAEVDRQHRRAIQQLQLELAEAKEQSETHSDDSTRFKVANSKESSPYLQGDGGNTSTTEDAGGASLLSAKSPQMPGVPLVQPSIVGMGAFIPPGPVIAPHPFVVHPPVSASYQHWPSQQVMPDVHQSSGQSESHQKIKKVADPVPYSPNVLARVPSGEVPPETADESSNLQTAQVSIMSDGDKHKMNEEISKTEAVSSRQDPVSFSNNGPTQQIMHTEAASGKPQPNLLDERALLACLARAIPAESGNRISISSTLHNRLSKILAPLQWNDYAKQYGKLEEFVARHPELFAITGDLIHLRDGAKEIISASTAVAKAAAVAASMGAYSSVLASVAVTPVAQSHRQKKDFQGDSSSGKSAGVGGQWQNGNRAQSGHHHQLAGGSAVSPPQTRVSGNGRRGRVSSSGMNPKR